MATGSPMSLLVSALIPQSTLELELSAQQIPEKYELVAKTE
jgi:hypothetical protein